MQNPKDKTTGLVWFRNDLRSQDQQSIANSISQCDRVIGVFCIEPRWFEPNNYGVKKMEKFRAKFLLETLQDLESELKSLQIPLVVVLDSPENTIPTLVDEYKVTSIYLQEEWTSEEKEIEHHVQQKLALKKIHWIYSYDQFLFHPDDIPFKISEIPAVFTNFRKKVEKNCEVRRPIHTSNSAKFDPWPSLPEIPSLEDLGFSDFEIEPRTAFPFYGGSSAGMDRLQYYFWESKKLSYYKKTRNGLVGADYSSKFSPWLANGSLSARQIYHHIKKYEAEVGKNQSTYWLIFELIWRDYFKYISLKHGDRIFYLSGIKNINYHWNRNKNLLKKWIDGQTAEPFVNANMVELKTTGWMSNRGRQNVASFLAKELKVDWRLGAAYFEAMLIDYDVHSNYGNWMYVAGVGNDPRDRKFNVSLQAERYDPDQRFRKRWLQTTLF